MPSSQDALAQLNGPSKCARSRPHKCRNMSRPGLLAAAAGVSWNCCANRPKVVIMRNCNEHEKVVQQRTKGPPPFTHRGGGAAAGFTLVARPALCQIICKQLCHWYFASRPSVRRVITTYSLMLIGPSVNGG